MLAFSLRQIRTFLAVEKHASVTAAARFVCRSQTSVTKSIQDLEKAIDATLFDRTSKGMNLTAYGEVLLRHAREAAAAFSEAQKLVPPRTVERSSGTARFFQMDVSDKWVSAFLATVEHQNTVAAAHSLGISAAGISSSVRKLEDSLGFTLFERIPNLIVPTTIGSELARYIKLARSQLRHAEDELSSLKGVHSGRVAIGALPLLRTTVVPKAILKLLEEHAYIDISTLEGTYDTLVSALRCGDIDFMVGALRGLSGDEELAEEPLLDEQLAVIARHHHPLQQMKAPNLSSALEFGWVLPRRGTPTRSLFEQLLSERGLPVPEHVIETSSMVTLRGLLLESDRVTVLSRHQVHYDELYGLLCALPINLEDPPRPIGITTRANSVLAPAAELLIEEIRVAVADLESTA